MERTYAVLCWLFGALALLVGLQFLATFFASLAPDAAPAFRGAFPIGPTGLYFVAFSGCCLGAWCGALFGAARASRARRGNRTLARAVGTATAVALVLHAVYRMAVWFMGDFAWLGEIPRFEAGGFLLLALAFLLLRPAKRAREVLSREII
jgi:hypothetical protein